jgi:hypothetical protein
MSEPSNYRASLDAGRALWYVRFKDCIGAQPRAWREKEDTTRFRVDGRGRANVPG